MVGRERQSLVRHQCIQCKTFTFLITVCRDAGKGGGGAGGPRPSCPFSRGAGGAKVPFHKIYLFKNEQALAEVIICVKAESGVIARTEILRLYLLQAL